MLSSLCELLPGEDYLYLGDTARLPYGTKSAATVIRYALRAGGYLVERGVKALVVACNTASAVALPAMQQAWPHIPVFGVVEPGAQAAASAAAQSHSAGVLVLATGSTVSGGAYQRALLQQHHGLQVYARSCPLWVTLAETGPQSELLVETVLANDLRGFSDSARISTLLLGCTHFPVFKARLGQLCEGATIVDSAQTTAQVVLAQLQAHKLTNDATGGGCQMMATDDAKRFARVGAYFLAPSMGDRLAGALANVEVVDLG